MMKKMLTIAAAALALSACGSDAPSVEEVSTPTTVTPAIQELALEKAWDSMDDAGQHDLCGMFIIDLDYFMETMDPASMDLSENQLIDFFAEKCF